jgi:hypothetical protein
MKDGKDFYIGCFNTKEEAADAYRVAALWLRPTQRTKTWVEEDNPQAAPEQYHLSATK